MLVTKVKQTNETLYMLSHWQFKDCVGLFCTDRVSSWTTRVVCSRLGLDETTGQLANWNMCQVSFAMRSAPRCVGQLLSLAHHSQMCPCEVLPKEARPIQKVADLQSGKSQFTKSRASCLFGSKGQPKDFSVYVSKLAAFPLWQISENATLKLAGLPVVQ